MKEEIKNQLLALNRLFYSKFADAFASSREKPQPGFEILLNHIPNTFENVLDVGCGNGRFGRFLRNHTPDFEYVGIDFTKELLEEAAENVSGMLITRDISQPGFLENFGLFDLIMCLSTMQHIPGISNRIKFLAEMGNHLAGGGKLILGNWQFMDSPRQQRKIQSWEKIGLTSEDLEANDYLLSWKREGFGLRYVCMINAQETAFLADEASLLVEHQFRSDGKEGNLNLYTILGKL